MCCWHSFHHSVKIYFNFVDGRDCHGIFNWTSCVTSIYLFIYSAITVMRWKLHYVWLSNLILQPSPVCRVTRHHLQHSPSWRHLNIYNIYTISTLSTISTGVTPPGCGGGCLGPGRGQLSAGEGGGRGQGERQVLQRARVRAGLRHRQHQGEYSVDISAVQSVH